MEKEIEKKQEVQIIEEYVPKKVNFDVFVSYRRVDGRDHARNIQLGLQQRGSTFNVFFDYASLRDGKFNLQILDAIYSCKVFILVITPRVFENCQKEEDWIMREVRAALKYNKQIIPCVIIDPDAEQVWKGWPKNLPQDVCRITDEERFDLYVNRHFDHSINDLKNICQNRISEYNLALINEFNSQLGLSGNKDGINTCESITVRGVSFNMVYVEGGAFLMGATEEQSEYAAEKEFPVHPVSLNDYYIGQTQVTQELWEAIMGDNPSANPGDIRRPIEMVNWHDCNEFIDKLKGLTGKKFRLPTEAEWEYAARGGKYSKGYIYSGSNNLDEVAWTPLNSEDSTHAVGTKMPNELGIYDMSGNVWEWCGDFYSNYSSDHQDNPSGPAKGTQRVMRGGSYFATVDLARVSTRYSPKTTRFKAHPLGFRLVMEIDKK